MINFPFRNGLDSVAAAPVVIRAGVTRGPVLVARWHRCSSTAWLLARAALLCALSNMIACKSQAQTTTAPGAETIVRTECLPGGKGFMRARLSGVIKTEIAWGNDTDCSGAVRPTDGGIRMRFAGDIPVDKGSKERLVLVFGISGLREGQSAQTLGVNLTVIREGSGQFYSTRGEDKCTLDKVTREPLVGIPHRSRSYRLVARGFCTEPARAVRGEGVILLSRFDFAGRVDFDTEDTSGDKPTATASR
jgi:hypothetical protein